MNKFIQNIRNKIQYKRVEKTHFIDDDLDGEVTDEIEMLQRKLESVEIK